MTRPRPTKAFAGVTLDLATIPAGQRFGRIYPARYPDPLGVRKTPSRFSDPRRRVAVNRFGVRYLGTSLKVCFVEAVLRDVRNGVVGDYPIGESDIRARHYAAIETIEPLRVVDLRDDGPLRMGVPSDVVRGSNQSLARSWSVAFHTHPNCPNGVIYPSRLNGEVNLALYDRAVGNVAAASTGSLFAAAGLAGVLNVLKVALM